MGGAGGREGGQRQRRDVEEGGDRRVRRDQTERPALPGEGLSGRAWRVAPDSWQWPRHWPRRWGGRSCCIRSSMCSVRGVCRRLVGGGLVHVRPSACAATLPEISSQQSTDYSFKLQNCSRKLAT